MELGFRILGPLQALADTRPVDIGGRRPRRLLAMLLLNPGRVVPAPQLVEAVWDDDPPPSAGVTLRSHVASLRRSLAVLVDRDLLDTRPPGYRLMVAEEHVDAYRFERLVEQGLVALRADDGAQARRLLREALELWHGEVLEDLAAPRFAASVTARLEQLRLAALEGRIDADLATGGSHELVPELEALVSHHPFRERLHAQLMLALYRAGRQADALAAHQVAHRQLRDELGLTPGPELAALQAAILRQDPGLMHPQALAGTRLAAGPSPPAAGGSRRVATIPALLRAARRVPLVGREGELLRLRTLWEQARTGSGRIALIGGEAGVGKSRLVAELAGLTGDDAAHVLVGHGEQAALVPYQPVTEALLGVPDLHERLAALPDLIRAPLTRLLDPAGTQPSAAGTSAPLADEQRMVFLHAVVRLLTGVSETAPVLLVVEDAERIDRASARLLAYLGRHLPDRMLLVLCYRDPPGSRHLALLELLADLESRGLAARLRVEPLSEADLATLVAARTGTDLPEGFVHQLWLTTGGNAFFATEVVRELLDGGGLGSGTPGWQVPSSVRTVLRQRLQALSASAREAIGGAAVLGREVDPGFLAEVTGRTIEEVIAALEEASSAGWFVATGQSAPVRFAFRHALMVRAVHDEVPAPRRQQLHLRAADVLQATATSGSTSRAAAAVHLRAAGSLVDPERAARASLEAAAQTAALYAWDDAIAHAEAAVTIRRHAGARPEHQAAAEVQAAQILLQSGTGLDRAVEHLRTAIERYRDAGDPDAVAATQVRLGVTLTLHHSVLDVPAARACFAAAEPIVDRGEAAFELASGRALADMYALEHEAGARACEHAVDLATQLDREDLVARVRPTQAVHELGRGGVARAFDLIDRAWASLQRGDDPHLTWEIVMAASLLANVYLLDPKHAESWCRRGLAQRRLASVALAYDSVADHLAYALATTGRMAPARELAQRLPGDALVRRLLLRLDGDLDGAERSWSAALEHDLANGDLMNAGLNAYWLGEVRWQRHADESAVETLRRALRIVDHGPQVPARLMVCAELSRCLAALDRVDEAEEHLASCTAILEGGEDWRGRTGHVQLARAAVAAARGRQQLADEEHAAALETFTRHHLPWWRAQALRSWAGWLTAANRSDEAEARHAAARRQLEDLKAADHRNG